MGKALSKLVAVPIKPVPVPIKPEKIFPVEIRPDFEDFHNATAVPNRIVTVPI